MRLLLDESVPTKLRRSLPSHLVRTVVEMGWSGVKNGRLLALAAKYFYAFITVDKNLEFQQNLATLPIAVIVLDAHSNELARLQPLVPALERALAALTPGVCIRVTSSAGHDWSDQPGESGSAGWFQASLSMVCMSVLYFLYERQPRMKVILLAKL